MTTPLYVPKGASLIKDLPPSQIRVVIQGPPFSGKTTAALTFPNPVVLSFDRKVSAHKHRDDVVVVPFYSPEFVDSLVKRPSPITPTNRKEALIKWLESEGLNITPEQTLIIDNCSEVEKSFHVWFDNNKHLAITKDGDFNQYKEWDLKIDYFDSLHTALKACHCHVVFIAHETPQRNKKGELTGKNKPLLSGQSGDKLGGNFTDYFRATTITKPTTEDQFKKTVEWARTDLSTVKDWCSKVGQHDTIYLWQTCADEECDCGTSSMRGCPKYVYASYESFLKYKI